MVINTKVWKSLHQILFLPKESSKSTQYTVIGIFFNSSFYRKQKKKFTLMAYQVFDLMIQKFFNHVKFMFNPEITVHVS